MRIEDVKIGMRVKSKVSLFGLTIGQEGTVRMLNPLTNPSTIVIGVEFDEYVGGHSIGGIINKFTGCWLIADWIEGVVEEGYGIRDEIATWRKSVDYIKSTQGKTTSAIYVKRNNMDISYKIGDKVRFKGTTLRGTIIGFVPDKDKSIIVEFDKQLFGHSFNGCCGMSKDWNLSPRDIELVEDSKPEVKDLYVGMIVELKTGTVPNYGDTVGRIVEIFKPYVSPIKVEFPGNVHHWYKPIDFNVVGLPGIKGKTKIISLPQDKYTFAPADGVIKEPNVTFSIKGDKEKLDKYSFRTSNLSIDKVTEDALQDGTIAFILIGEKNAIVGVLQCHECERDALYRIQDAGTYYPKYVNGEFTTPFTVEEWGTFERAYFFNIISKDKIGKAKEILKEIKRKDVIRKELIDYKIKEQTNITGNKKERFSVLTF